MYGIAVGSHHAHYMKLEGIWCKKTTLFQWPKNAACLSKVIKIGREFKVWFFIFAQIGFRQFDLKEGMMSVMRRMKDCCGAGHNSSSYLRSLLYSCGPFINLE
jgi:hypothetical protein